MKKKKNILLLPLDERPCNYLFPLRLTEDNPEYRLLLPRRERLGKMKLPADIEYIQAFLLDHAQKADIAVISVDMLLYGGLLYSRLHHFSEEKLRGRLEILRTMKQRNPALKIYAFQLIMRCPQYSSSEEEPDYYEECGREIFLLGEAYHKRKLGLPVDENLIKLYEKMTAGKLDDYLTRRKLNTDMNLHTVDLLGDVIDYLIIPQDDSSLYGFIKEDQQRIYGYVKKSGKEDLIQSYPGADEVGMTLVCRAILKDLRLCPSVKIFYNTEGVPRMVPKYEDRELGLSLRSQIATAGCRIAEDNEEADYILAVNGVEEVQLEAPEQENAESAYCKDRRLPSFVERIANAVHTGKKVAVADVAYGNGGDLKLVSLLEHAGIALDVLTYGGWNTSGNTLGTVISAASLSAVFGKTGCMERFLALRYYEDVGFCAHSRMYVAERLNDYGCSYSDLGEKEKEISELVRAETQRYLAKLMPSLVVKYEIASCKMPWNRMFETEFEINGRP